MGRVAYFARVRYGWRWTEGGVERVGTFLFPCPYDWYYKFRHAVDDHNNLRHALPSIEHTITTTSQCGRVVRPTLKVAEVGGSCPCETQLLE
jgi:hypothetical protein